MKTPNCDTKSNADEAALRLEVLKLAIDIADRQHLSKEEEAVRASGVTPIENVTNTILQDTLRNAKKLWKFIELTEKAEDCTKEETES
jgi:hypothetical protein